MQDRCLDGDAYCFLLLEYSPSCPPSYPGSPITTPISVYIPVVFLFSFFYLASAEIESIVRMADRAQYSLLIFPYPQAFSYVFQRCTSAILRGVNKYNKNMFTVFRIEAYFLRAHCINRGKPECIKKIRIKYDK